VGENALGIIFGEQLEMSLGTYLKRNFDIDLVWGNSFLVQFREV
jgi:hypothetical protein